MLKHTKKDQHHQHVCQFWNQRLWPHSAKRMRIMDRQPWGSCSLMIPNQGIIQTFRRRKQWPHGFDLIAQSTDMKGWLAARGATFTQIFRDRDWTILDVKMDGQLMVEFEARWLA